MDRIFRKLHRRRGDDPSDRDDRERALRDRLRRQGADDHKIDEMMRMMRHRGGNDPDDMDDMDIDDFDYMMFFHPMVGRSYDRDREAEKEEESPVGSDGFRFKFIKPASWRIPKMRDPISVEEEASDVEVAGASASSASSKVVDYGVVQKDAKLFRLREKMADKSVVTHSILKMPSTHLNDNLMTTTGNTNTFNIVMVDVSGSMSSYWNHLETSWNKYVSPKLSGGTRIFCFDSTVRFKRSDTFLEKGDFTSGSTELTGALQTIVTQVYECTQKYVNVFIVTDGDHNMSNVTPAEVIEQMEAPRNKICSVYLLGLGSHFPVKYSIDIRSRLHNGSSNLPSLYWAKQGNEIQEQMEDIANNLTSGASLLLKLNASGTSLPGLTPKNKFHLQEYVYLENEPENYMPLRVQGSNCVGQFNLQPQEIEVEELFNVFRQWNSVIFQLKFNKHPIPKDIIPLMERIFEAEMNKSNSDEPRTIKERLSKTEKAHEMEFRTLVNKVKTILTEEKFVDQLELAETILSSAVTKSKYEVRALQLKGHTDKEYEADCEAFMKVYDENKEVIKGLKDQPQDKCQATKQSTLTDLQDEDLPELMKRNKFEFLKEFTISGIPVFSPMRDAVSLNPWAYSVQRILDAPYTIMSQVAMETMAKNSTDNRNKSVQAKDDDESTNFNAIVPVFPSNIAKQLRPIVRTRLYAMCATFAILKNPHMVDFNIHMAALGVTWVRFLFDHPNIPRPEHVKVRMESIEATANCYMDRPGFANYAKLLLENPQEALMTESSVMIEGKTVKCETLIKPMFILNMIQLGDLKVDTGKLGSIIKVMVLEYIGRCLSHYGKKMDDEEESTPFTDFFADSLADQERKKQIMEKYVQDCKTEMSQSSANLLGSFYSYDEVSKAARQVAATKVDEMKVKMEAEIPAKVNMEKVLQLRNVTSAGDVSLNTLQTFARHVGLGESEVNEIFGEKHIFVCTAHALKYRASRERLANGVQDYETCKKTATKNVQVENLKAISKSLYNALVEALQEEWLREYRNVHTEVVEPMSRQQIIHQAQALGIDVTEETFDSVYKRYRPQVGLLGNACQTKACPYYLQPKKSYNNHASVERKKGGTTFVHGMHQATFQNCESDLPTIMSKLASGTLTKEKKPVPEEDVKRWETGIKRLKNIYKETKDDSQGNS